MASRPARFGIQMAETREATSSSGPFVSRLPGRAPRKAVRPADGEKRLSSKQVHHHRDYGPKPRVRYLRDGPPPSRPGFHYGRARAARSRKDSSLRRRGLAARAEVLKRADEG